MTIPDNYSCVHAIPSLDDYMRLRRESGLTPRDALAAEAGLPNSFVAVVIAHEGETVGMGRVIGDGGLFFQVVDIAVLPAHQGKGLGKAIMRALMDRLAQSIAAAAYVSLIADGEARHLYVAHGFAPVAPKSISMA